MVVQEAHDMRQGEEGRHYTAKEIQLLNKSESNFEQLGLQNLDC